MRFLCGVLQNSKQEGEREEVGIGCACILRFFCAIFLIKELTSRTIQRNVNVGEYLPGEMMLFQMGIKTSFI